MKDAGDKSKINIHLDTKDYGYLTIETGEAFLKEKEENLLFRRFGSGNPFDQLKLSPNN